MQQFFNKHHLTLSSFIFLLSCAYIVLNKMGLISFLGAIIILIKLAYLGFFISIGYIFFNLIKKKISLLYFLKLTSMGALVMIFGSHMTNKMHYVFDVFASLWIIIFGISLIHLRHKNDSTKKEIKQKKFPALVWIFILILTLSHFFFASYKLDEEAYTDERLWTYGGEKRIEKFWNNVLEGDWKNARPSDKPGVTLAIVSGIGLIWTTPSDFFHNTDDSNALLKMLATMRYPVVVFGSLAIPILFIIIRRLGNQKIALIVTTFYSLSSILIGAGKMINPDAFLFIFMPFSLFAYLIYEQENDKKWLYLTGIFLGLGLLTKYVSNLLFVFFPAVIFIQMINQKIDKKTVQNFIRKKILDYITITFIAVTVFYLLFPGTWVKIDRLLLGTLWSQAFEPVWKPFIAFISLIALDNLILKAKISKSIMPKLYKLKPLMLYSIPVIFLLSIIAMSVITYSGMTFFNFEEMLSTPKSAGKGLQFAELGIYLSGFYALFFAISPLASLGAIISNLCTIKKIKENNISKLVLTNWYILFFIIIYYAASAFSGVGPMTRYQVIIYPLIYVSAGIGIYALYDQLKNKYPAKKVFVSLLIIITIYQFYTLYAIKPYFFSYNSPLLPQSYLVNPKGIGEGNYEAAHFLNEKPNAENMNVWSDNAGVCRLFAGTCTYTNTKKKFIEKGPQYDYYVISKGRESKVLELILPRVESNPNYDFRLDRIYTTDEYEYEFSPGNREKNYIRIIPADNIEVIPE